MCVRNNVITNNKPVPGGNDTKAVFFSPHVIYESMLYILIVRDNNAVAECLPGCLVKSQGLHVRSTQKEK